MNGYRSGNSQLTATNLPRKQFENLALGELDSLYRMARRLTHEPSRAEDLVQETFARALASCDGFDLFGFGVKPWLMRILYNLHLNRIARDKRHPASFADSALQSDDNSSQENRLPLNPTSFEAMNQEVVRALDHLPSDYRTIMLLWAVEELSYKEISSILEIPMGTVMSRLYRARCKLATELRTFASREGLIRE
jgi:RNA polymerase sigma-70 factor, ECF subfamily